VSATLGDDQAARDRRILQTTPAVRSGQRLGDAARIWWLNPASLLIFIILPIFGSAILLASPIMAKFGAYNFLTIGPIMLAIGSIFCMAFSSMFGERVVQYSNSSRAVSSERVVAAILVFSLISIAAHILLVGTIIIRPSLMVAVLTGERGAIYVAKNLMNQIPGVTSFTQVFLLALPLYGVLPHLTGRKPPTWLRNVIIALLSLLVLRSFMIAERLTLVEAAVALIVPRVAFMSRIPPLTKFMPLIGFVTVTALFFIGEYTRSWAYYRYEYGSFFEFGYTRLVGYLATATNNGAGILEVSGSLSAPYYTAGWYHKLPLWDFIPNPLPVNENATNFFKAYANEEFNNTGGLMAPFLDFGVPAGFLIHAAFGAIGGFLFSLFRRTHVVGILLFPMFYLGFMTINQAYYWTNARVFIPLVLAIPVYYFVTYKIYGRKGWRQSGESRGTPMSRGAF